MKKFRINPSLPISMVALFVALGGVSYAAATIGSGQIVNNSVRSKDVKNGDLRGKDLKANTIGGTRVLESSLAKVPNAGHADSSDTANSASSAATASNASALEGASLNSIGAARDAFDSACEPGGAALVACEGATITLTRPAKVVAHYNWSWTSDDAPGSSVLGACRTQQNGVNTSGEITFGSLSHRNDDSRPAAAPPVTDVRGPLAAGTYTFRLACRDSAGDVDNKDIRTLVTVAGTD
jgi:hypothetical protein